MAEISFATTNALVSGLVTGSTQNDKNKVYVISALYGVSIGWMYPSQRTLSVALIPKGQEFEIMGLMAFFGQILGWLPVFIFTALNEAGVDMRWGLASLSFFLLTSCLCTLGVGSYENAVQSVEHTSERFLQEFALRNGTNKEENLDVKVKLEVGATTLTGSGTIKLVN
jgi:MFS-type transporter involved in bile tolerance (Atg22 family)